MTTNLGQTAMLVTTNQAKLVVTNHRPMAMLVSTHFTKLVVTHLAKSYSKCSLT